MESSSEDLPSNPLDMFVLSHDTLFETDTDETISPQSGWSTRPNRDAGLFSSRQNERANIMAMLQQGVPNALRCAVWTTNVVWGSDPDMAKTEVDEYGTLKKVRIYEHGWKICLQSCFPDESDERDAHIPEFGLGSVHMVNLLLKDLGAAIPESGAKALKRVLFAAHHSLGIDYCPMLPNMAAVFLTAMDESYVYATIRKMLENSSHFIALSKVEYLAWCKSFGDLMKRIYPETHYVLEHIGLLKPSALDPIFKRFFVTLLRLDHVKRLMDLFTLEGKETLFRFGTGLLFLYHANLSSRAELNVSDTTSWWKGLRNFCHSRRFKFDVFLEKQVYGFVAGRFRNRSIFPRKQFFHRLIERNEEWAEENRDCHESLSYEEEATLGFVESEDLTVTLARHAAERTALASWLPASLTSAKLETIYSSSVHGRTIERYYHHCSKARQTVTLFEILGRDAVIGMYATETWRKNKEGYGNAECFLFRFRPNPACFKWTQTESESESESNFGSETIELAELTSSVHLPAERADRKSKQRLFADQVMVSGDDFISMGIGKDGASGLRINEDLTRGSTSPAMGFGHESLLGDDSQDSVFDIGLVEVYRFVREVDGKPVDRL